MDLLATTIVQDLVTMGVPLADKVARTIAVYIGLVVLLRVAGKRDLAQLNSFDLVVLLLLSNVVQNAVIGPDNSLTGGLLGAVVLLGANACLVRFASHHDWFSRVIEGRESPLVVNGGFDHASLRDVGLTEAEVLTAVRRQGASAIDDVARATLMPGGTITVELNEADQGATKGDVERLERKLDELLVRLAGGAGPTLA
ncbi:MAG: YetF domain-containing protein [Aquihabitans sp.]